MFCTNCGKEVPLGANFCAACGTRVDASTAASSTPSPAPGARPAATPTPNTVPLQPTPIPEPTFQMEPAGSAWPRWVWYLVVFALFNVAGRNLLAGVFGNGLLTAAAGIGVGIAGVYGAAALLERTHGTGTRLLTGVGIVVVACALALVAQVMKESLRPAKQNTTVAAAPTAQTIASGKLSGADVFDASPEQQATTTSLDVPDPFVTHPQPAVAQNANCVDYTSAAIPSQYTGARVSINFQSVPIDTFLKLISEESGITIININNLDDPITICATNIPWDYALDTVLSANGHTRNTIGEAIYIH